MAAAGTAAGPAGPEPMPSYAQLVQRGWGSALAAARGCADCGWGLARRGLAEHAHLAPPELLLLALGALGWTALRSAATSRLFRPLAKWCRLQPRDAAKMPESAWKFLFYLGAWSYSAYLLFGTDYPFFHDPPSVFHDWKTGMPVPRDIAVAYLLQGSFYGHSIYATLYLDAWRKDSVVMLIHHVVTLVLIVSSYAFRYHKVGILVLFLHDISDVQLEFTKLNVYFKTRGGSHYRLHAVAADLGCLSFSLSWFWFRLYWFPLKVLYATSHCSLRAAPDIPFYFFFNALLLLLTLMNLYWFLYIVAFAAKVLTGQVRELKDLREYDSAEALSLKPGKAESLQGPWTRPQPTGRGAGQPLSTRPAAACEEHATAVPASGPPRPSPTGPAAALVTPGLRSRAPRPHRRPAPGSRVARRAPGRPQVPASTPRHVAPVPPPGPPGSQGRPAEDAPGGHPAAVPHGGAGGRRKHRAPRPGPRRGHPAPGARLSCGAVP
ncbi:ceramide synthase 1 isoform X3 [Hippopotamus amphibius kiboko]|uniref:ceramide synthase 1 isoform X3 n=1 Tax=Hippopotamus amphibius kiboko TaxID=575201 RepID=UPI0025967112|nr:ceramide synthase 1 isoform X3 [Hippopotamus amphibius kiboko]